MCCFKPVLQIQLQNEEKKCAEIQGEVQGEQISFAPRTVVSSS